MARVCPLFSGSSGNSTYISADGSGILVDAGASCKQLCEAINLAGGNTSEIKAIAITHEHIDHVQGLRVLVKSLGIPVIASKKTLETLIKDNRLPENAQLVCADDETVQFGKMAITRFATSHDCDGSSGYVITLPDDRKVSVCTDLGVVTDEVKTALTGSELVLIESNHDIEMLKRGPYPPQLKLRIMSDKGHLSNNTCAALLPELLRAGTSRFILGHLSRQNNLPVLALSASKASLMDIGAKKDVDYILTAAAPGKNEVTAL